MAVEIWRLYDSFLFLLVLLLGLMVFFWLVVTPLLQPRQTIIEPGYYPNIQPTVIQQPIYDHNYLRNAYPSIGYQNLPEEQLALEEMIIADEIIADEIIEEIYEDSY